MRTQQLIKVIVIMISMLSLSCGSKKEDHTNADSNTWKEMDDFHMVMAETFHPYKDSSDLAPVKSKASELVASADKWSSSPLPEKVNTDEMKEGLQKLKSETEVLADLVQAGGDDAIGSQLKKVHDLFHEIQEMWYGGGKGHEHEH